MPVDTKDWLLERFQRARAAGRLEEALAAGESILSRRPDVAIARACAEIHLQRGTLADARRALEKLRPCLDADLTHLPTLNLLARAFERAGFADNAARVRRGIARLHKPKNVVPLRAPSPREDATIHTVDQGWDEIIAEADARVEVARPSFWEVPNPPASELGMRDGMRDEESVHDVSVSDIELVDETRLVETALEISESLAAEGRLEEARLLLSRNLELRPDHRLLGERLAEIHAMMMPRGGMRDSSVRFTDSERSIPTTVRKLA